MMTHGNRLGLAAALAAALAFGGTARAQGSTGTGSTGGDQTTTTPGGAAAGGSSETTTTPSAGTGDTSTTTGDAHRPAGTAGDQASAAGTATGTAGSTGKVSKKLEQGLQKLHAANQAEVQMGQMAGQMAQDEKVKEYAQKMVDDHGKNDQQLEQLAQQVGVELKGPAFEKAQKDAEKDMSKLHAQGGDFDRRYMSHMVKDHQKDMREVAALAKQARSAKQTELASFLDETHTAMKGHLQEAKQVEKSTRATQRQGRRGAAGDRSGMGGMSGSGMGGSMHPGSGSGAAGSTPPSSEDRERGSEPAGSGTPAPGHKP